MICPRAALDRLDSNDSRLGSDNHGVGDLLNVIINDYKFFWFIDVDIADESPACFILYPWLHQWILVIPEPNFDLYHGT